jgi:transposase InsO family protein
MSSSETGGNKSSEQEHNDDVKTTGVATYGSLWVRCLS